MKFIKHLIVVVGLVALTNMYIARGRFEFRSTLRQPSEAELWLRQQSPAIKHIDVSYGSAWHGSIWKYISIHNQASIRKLMTSFRCQGSLTNTRLGNGVRDDGFLAYNTSYFISLIFKDPKYQNEQLAIIPSNDRFGIFFLVRQRNISSVASNFIGWAEMNRSQVEGFKLVLRSVRGRRWADIH